MAVVATQFEVGGINFKLLLLLLLLLLVVMMMLLRCYQLRTMDYRLSPIHFLLLINNNRTPPIARYQRSLPMYGTYHS
jgi:hypothetical protein